MKRKISLIILILLCIIPFIKVNAMSKEDIYSTTPKKGYRCYVACKTPECRSKMTFYTNRDMSNILTYNISITENGTKENLVSSNSGINLFAKRIQYPDAQEGVYFNIAEFYTRALDGVFDFRGDVGPLNQSKQLQEVAKKFMGDKYDAAIKKFNDYNENDDIDPFSCLMAAETFRIVLNSSNYTTEKYYYIYENDYNSGTIDVYNLGMGEVDLNEMLLLEGTGFYILPSQNATPGSIIGDLDPNEKGSVYEVPKITDDNATYNTTLYHEFKKEEKDKINFLQFNLANRNTAIQADGSTLGNLTHEELIDYLDCVKVNHDLTEVEKQCKTEFEAAGKETSGSEWNKCLRDKGYVYINACETGFTIGVLPQFKYSEEAQQQVINNVVSQGSYKFRELAFQFMASGSAISCYDIRFATYIWRAICILAPFLFIIFGSLDFIKAIMASDEKGQKEAKQKLPKRIIAFIGLLVLPVILKIIFSVGAYNSNNLGLFKCVVTFDTTSKKPVNKSKSADVTKDPNAKKLKCDDYGVDSCPEYPESDDYGYFCAPKPFADDPDKVACQRTGETKKKCDEFALSNCPEEDDYGNKCEPKKDENQSTPVCSFKK